MKEIQYYILILMLININNDLTECKLIKNPVLADFKYGVDVTRENERIESLQNLLEFITERYLKSCSVIVLHNFTSTEKELQPIVMRRIYRDALLTSYVQENLQVGKKMNFVMENKCYNYLAFVEDIFAIHKIVNREIINKLVVVTSSESWTVKHFLKNHLSRAFVNLLIVTHSNSRRAAPGSYLLYTHKLFTDGSGSSEPLLITSWIRNGFTNPHVTLFPKKLKDDFKGHRFMVSTVEERPFAIRKAIYGSDVITWDGIDIRVVKLLGEILNFTIVFNDPESAMTNVRDAVLEDVATGVSSAAVGGIYNTVNLTKHFDILTSHLQDCASFITPASTALPKHRAVLGPFQISVWVLLIIAYFIVIIPLSANAESSTLALLRHPKTLNEMFWYVLSTFTNAFSIPYPLESKDFGKNAIAILIGFYWVFTIIITSCYTSSIISFITIPVYPVAMDTAEQLLDNGYRIGTLDQDCWKVWFNNTMSDDPVAKALLKDIEFVPTVNEGITNVTRAFFWSYAFLGSRILLEYIVQADFAPNWRTKRSVMHISEECFLPLSVSIILPRKTIYTNALNEVILKTREAGILEKIIQDVEWDIQRSSSGLLLQVSKGPPLKRIQLEERMLTLDDMQGMFLILGAGFLIGFFLLFVEVVVHRIGRCWRDSRKVPESNIEEERGISPSSTISGDLSSISFSVDSFRADPEVPELRLRTVRASI